MQRYKKGWYLSWYDFFDDVERLMFEFDWSPDRCDKINKKMWARVKLGQDLLQPAQNSQPNQFRHDQFKVKKKEGQKWIKKRNILSKVIKKLK